MRASLAVARRELHERAFVLVGAASAGLLALLVPLLPGLGRTQPRDVREAAAGMLFVALTSLLALALGATAFPLSASDRRLGFFFARPITGPSLWLGKTVASVVLLAGFGLLVLAPAWVVDALLDEPPGAFLRAFTGSWPLLLLFPAGHLGSLVARSRSAWLLVDVVAGCAFVSVAAHVTKQLAQTGMEPVAEALDLVSAAIAAGLVLSSLTAVVLGRLDVPRARRWCSITLWACALAGLAALFGFRSWNDRPAIEDVEGIHLLDAAPDGPWIAFGGPCRGSWSFFLLDVESGEYLRTGRHRASLTEFTPSGDTAAWFETRGEVERLVVADLKGGQPEIRGTGIERPGDQGRFFVAIAPVEGGSSDAGLYLIGPGDEIVEMGSSPRPVATLRNDQWSLRQRAAVVGAPSTAVFVDHERTSLVRVDPVTAAREVLVGAGR